MDSPRPSRRRLAFLIGTPLAWAILLLFHAGPDPDDLYGGLRDEVTRWQVVHLGTLVFIGLMGAALYLLVRDLPGKAARISRLAIGPFVLFYGAGEAILGVATGVLVQHANNVPAGERPAAADAVKALWDNPISDDLLLSIGGVAWVVAAIAAAIAYRGVGAPMSAVAAPRALVDRGGARATRGPARSVDVRHRRGPARTHTADGAGRKPAGLAAGVYC